MKLKIAAGLVISSKRSGGAARPGQQRKAVVILGRSQVQMCEDQTVGHVKVNCHGRSLIFLESDILADLTFKGSNRWRVLNLIISRPITYVALSF